MGVRRADVTLKTNASGAGTATASVAGLIHEVRYGGTILNDEAKADFTITRYGDGGTILALSSVAGPWQRAPRQTIHTDTGGTIQASGPLDYIPVEGQIQIVIAEGAASVEDTISVFYDS